MHFFEEKFFFFHNENNKYAMLTSFSFLI